MANQITLNIPEAFNFLFTPSRYKIIYGGRGSGKTRNAALALVVLAYQSPLRVLCGREFQKSLEDSVLRELSDAVYTLKLQNFFEIQKNCIIGQNGSYFAFSGFAKNVEALKSLSNFDMMWIEEGDTVSKASWTTLVPTFRKNTSEIWVTMNPKLADSFMYTEFINNPNPPKNAIIKKINYDQNPFFPKILEDQRVEMLERDPELYDHVWEGNVLALSSARVFPKITIDDLDDKITTLKPMVGMDFGFSVDPTVVAIVYVIETPEGQSDILYIKDTYYRHKLEIDEYPGLLRSIPELKDYTLITADNSQPALISHLKKYQFNIRGCRKFQGSVVEGVKFMQNFNIVIHPTCSEAITEFMTYKYKVKDEKILTDIDQKNDHVIDSVRYAIEPLQRKQLKSKISIPISIDV